MNKIELQQELNNTLYQIRFYNGKLSKVIMNPEKQEQSIYYQELIAANEKYYKFLKERLADV